MKGDIELWFEGYVGIDCRIAVSKLPEKFSVEAWEALDAMLRDEPTLDIDFDSTDDFYRFELELESGFEGCDDFEFAFSIKSYDTTKDEK